MVVTNFIHPPRVVYTAAIALEAPQGALGVHQEPKQGTDAQLTQGIVGHLAAIQAVGHFDAV